MPGARRLVRSQRITAAVLIAAGDQVPVMPFAEVNGKTGAVLFWHSGPIRAKVGVMLVVIVTSIVIPTAH